MAAHKSPPNEFIKLILIPRKKIFHIFRPAQNIGRTNRFMRFLRAFFRLKHVRRIGKIFFSERLFDKLACFGNSLPGDIDRIGAHVSDQADRAFFADVNTFIKLLGNHHGFGGIKPELIKRFLLKSACDKRRLGVSLDFFFCDICNRKLFIFDLRYKFVGFFLRFKFEFFAVNFFKRGG